MRRDSSKQWPRSWPTELGAESVVATTTTARVQDQLPARAPMDEREPGGGEQHADVPLRRSWPSSARETFLYHLKAGLRAAAAGGRPRPLGDSIGSRCVVRLVARALEAHEIQVRIDERTS